MPPRRPLAFALCLFAFAAHAQDATDALLSPAAFLGYELGERFTPHHRVLDYYEHVAARAPGVRLEPYGESYEGRPLVVAYVTAPERVGRLDGVRQANLRLVEGTSDPADVGAVPALVWLSYNVHGNESVSTEASMATLHALADPNNQEAQAWLEDAVAVLDPCLNPDGRERYVQWYRQTRGAQPNADPAAREHEEPWPGGRTNHYYFDLNRDWAWGVQQETRARLALYQRWMPHVHVDFHEQSVDAPYYFAPAAEPFHERITDWQRDFQTTIGQNHARYFDERGWLYFTRERFDLFYPAYGDTWPTFNGAIGMTYEQAGSGRAGLAVQTAEGDTLTLGERVEHHHTTGLSTVEAAADRRAELVRQFAAYFERARTSPEGPYKTYVVKATNEPDRLQALAAYLDEQGIAYGWADSARSATGFSYRTGETGPADVAPGDLVVSAYQARSTLAQTLFEPEAALADSLTYDVTAWALPYAYDLNAYALRERIGKPAPERTSRPEPARTSALPERPYAYLLEWQSLADVRFLSRVLQAGVRARFAERPFTTGGRPYPAGTLVLTRRGNEALGERFDQIVREAADALGQPLHAATSGFVTSGPDFGSSDVRHLEKPRVAVLSGRGVSAYALGEVWHFFDQQIGYPVTLLDAAGFRVADVRGYDVLVLPSGSYGDVLTPECLADLRGWVRAGGRLVVMERAISSFAGQDGFGIRSKENGGARADSLAQRRYADRDRRAISADVPGSVHRVEMDPTHPLAFGLGETYPTLKRSDDAYAFLEEGWNVGVLGEGGGRPVSGFAGYEAQQRLPETLVFGVEELGRGRVVYLVDNPLFRGFWHGGKLVFANAVFLVGQ